MNAKIFKFPINDFQIWEISKKHLIIIMKENNLNPDSELFWEIVEEAYNILPIPYSINEWVETCEMLCEDIQKYGSF